MGRVLLCLLGDVAVQSLAPSSPRRKRLVCEYCGRGVGASMAETPQIWRGPQGEGGAVLWVDCLWEGRKSMSSRTSSLACFMTLFLKFQRVVKNRNPRIKYFGLSSFGLNYFCEPQK